MNNSDLKPFVETWAGALETYGKPPSDAVVMMAFNLLEKYDLHEIKKALADHMTDPDGGQFIPKPADIVRKLQKVNPFDHLGADAAWAVALTAMDEDATVIYTEAIAHSCPNAARIYREGDVVGARMAFKADYEREITKAREAGQLAEPLISLGNNPAGRESVQEEFKTLCLAFEAEVYRIGKPQELLT